MSISSHGCNIIPFHHSLHLFTRMLDVNKLQRQSFLKQQATALKEKEFNLHSNLSKYNKWLETVYLKHFFEITFYW